VFIKRIDSKRAFVGEKKEMGNSRYGFLFERITFGETEATEIPNNFTEWKSFDWEKLELTLYDTLISFGLNLAMAIIIIVIGFIIIAIISRIFLAIAKKRKWDRTFVGWLNVALKALLKVIVLILAFTRLGINMATITGLLAAVGIAFSAALGNVIPNFVCGIFLVVLKPLHVGDWVSVAGVDGVVEELGIVNVKLCSWNNTVFFVPNSKAFNSIITNCSVLSKRRLDIFIPIAYSEDLDAVKDVIMSTLKSNPYVLPHPRPFIKVDAVDGSRITLSVNPWIKRTEDPFFFITFVWDVREEILRNMRKARLRFGVNCLNVDIHMGDQEPAPKPSKKTVYEAEQLLDIDHDEVFEYEGAPESAARRRLISRLRNRIGGSGDDDDVTDDDFEDVEILEAI